MDKSKQEDSKLQHAIKENLEEIDNLKDEKLSLVQVVLILCITIFSSK
jgi:hypothetical protein